MVCHINWQEFSVRLSAYNTCKWKAEQKKVVLKLAEIVFRIISQSDCNNLI